MKCLVLSSTTYTKKNGGGQGVRTNIVFRGQSGFDCKTIFGDEIYSAGSIYNFEFNPSGFLTCASNPEACEAFELLKECF